MKLVLFGRAELQVRLRSTTHQPDWVSPSILSAYVIRLQYHDSNLSVSDNQTRQWGIPVLIISDNASLWLFF